MGGGDVSLGGGAGGSEMEEVPWAAAPEWNCEVQMREDTFGYAGRDLGKLGSIGCGRCGEG